MASEKVMKRFIDQNLLNAGFLRQKDSCFQLERDFDAFKSEALGVVKPSGLSSICFDFFTTIVRNINFIINSLFLFIR